MVRVTKKGFTLIELLVVIAIIAVLAAILLPVFARVREKAYQTRCLSNMMQLTLGVAMYAADYDNRVPPTATGQGWERWFHVIAPWNALNTIEIYPGCGSVGPYIKDPKVTICPDWQTDNWVVVTNQEVPLAKYITYGSNDNMGGQPINRLLIPSQMIVVAESYCDSGYSPMWYNWDRPSRYRPAARHSIKGGGFHAGFADGHVEVCFMRDHWNAPDGGAAKYWEPKQQIVMQYTE